MIGTRLIQTPTTGRYLVEPAPRAEAVSFEGGHEWSPTFLGAAGRFLERIQDLKG